MCDFPICSDVQDSSKRPSVKQLLGHPWIQGWTAEVASQYVASPVASPAAAREAEFPDHLETDDSATNRGNEVPRPTMPSRSDNINNKTAAVVQQHQLDSSCSTTAELEQHRWNGCNNFCSDADASFGDERPDPLDYHSTLQRLRVAVKVLAVSVSRALLLLVHKLLSTYTAMPPFTI